MISVVLVEPEEAGNVGFVARVMKNFGFQKLFLVSPKCDLDEAKKFAKHAAHDVLSGAKILKSFSSARRKFSYLIGTTALRGGEYNVLRSHLTPRQLAARQLLPAGAAIVFGREGPGLTNEEVRQCDLLVSIPSFQIYPTMNVSHAVAVVLYEMFLSQQGSFAGPGTASKKTTKAVVANFSRLLEKCTLPKEKKRIKLDIFRRVLGKSMLTEREAHGLAGAFRKMRHALKHPEKTLRLRLPSSAARRKAQNAKKFGQRF